ncbi:LysR family transcriptional regulator [Humitalea rosea]|uniref:LysR family transcriptional regulator n=1 Tax=Humitalea rosea TaxID=990373 RepID=A0A2W7JG82_9PROT|nr:LysR family transcriptional regulator [Humitalea rosea]PZW51083.1 LysR family transcriptional regulator [Humitalea rosea]
MDTLRAMRVFQTVVQSGSLSSAGRQLGLSAPSVTRQIQALEEDLGARLFNRTSRRLALTEAGELYHRQVEQVLQQIEDARASVANLQTVPRGMLRVHTRVLVGMRFIVPALPHFLAANPEVSVDLLMSNFAVDLVDRHVDVDIRIGQLADSSLIARKLASSERIVCAAPAYLARHAAPVGPADLARHNCLTYRLNLGRPVWRFLDAAGALTEVSVTGNMQSDSGPALVAAAVSGLGLALLPDWSVLDELREGRLIRLFPEHRASHMEFENGVYAVYLDSRRMPTKLRVFLDFLAEAFRTRLGPIDPPPRG